MKDVIIGLGEILWDIFPDGKKLGGAPANFAYHMSRFGFDSRVVSAVGKDPLGDEILANLGNKRLGYHLARVPYPTGTVFAKVDEKGVPAYEITRETAWDYIPFTQDLEETAKKVRAVSFGSLAQRGTVSRRTIESFLDAVPSGPGRYKIFDINLRQDFYGKEVIENSLKRCDVLKINDEELDIVSRLFDLPLKDEREKCRWLLDRYALEILILTCGIRGSYVLTSREESFLETPVVKVADTVGAGDSFTAAFCACLLNGHSVFYAHRLAVDVAAFVCTSYGAMPELPGEFLERAKSPV